MRKRDLEIVRYWQQLDTEAGEFVHPEDEGHRFQLRRYGFADDLFPAPYVGSLADAAVVFAMINPGLQTGENSEYVMEKRPEMREALEANLRQDLRGRKYPFMCLDPELSYHPGYDYWYSRLKRSIEDFASRYNTSLEDAQGFFADNVAILELVPYHSVEYKGALHRTLPSSKQALRAFEQLRKERLVIVSRKHRDWGLRKPEAGEIINDDNLISYYNRAAMIGDQVRARIVEAVYRNIPT